MAVSIQIVNHEIREGFLPQKFPAIWYHYNTSICWNIILILCAAAVRLVLTTHLRVAWQQKVHLTYF